VASEKIVIFAKVVLKDWKTW